MSASESAATGSLSRRDSYGRPQRTGYHGLTVLAWIIVAVLTYYFVRHTAGARVPAATQVGRLYGLVGTVLFVFLAGYGVRRIAYRGQMGALEWWYRAHLLLGLVTLGLLACHSGFSMRRPFLVLLQLGFWGTLLTGILGWAYQTALKKWMVRHEFRPAVLKDLEARARELSEGLAPPAPGEADALATDAARRALLELARRRAGHLWPMQDWSFWDGQVEAVVSDVPTDVLNESARARLRELNRTEVLAQQHRILRGWTTVHLLFTVAAIQLILWHVAMVAGNPR